MDKIFKIEHVTLILVSSIKAETVMHETETTLININISKTRFCYLDGTKSISGKYKCLKTLELQEMFEKYT